MSNDSASGGYLAPALSPAPSEGSALNAFLHDVIAGVTGLPNQSVVPRWQPEPPNLPAYGTTWCAFGVTRRQADTNAWVTHDGASQGADDLQRHENLHVLTSFYSSTQDDADLNAEYLREGLQIDQNREQLLIAQWGLIETGETYPVPTLVKDRWLYRCDMELRFRRLITRAYPVLNLLAASVILITDVPPTSQTLQITNPFTP